MLLHESSPPESFRISDRLGPGVLVGISREELLRLARSGAAARVQELLRELESIYKTFPDLRSAKGGRAGAPARTPGSKTGKRAWTAADRRAVSERMKKYWATRGSAKAGKPTK